MDALIRRIEQEERAKTMECGCIGCTNMATHTWSGHPTCDACGTPGRKQRDFPLIYACDLPANDKLSGAAPR